jgi:alpha-1,6-mannosyltransferase
MLLPAVDILLYPMLMQSLARGFLLLINANGWVHLAYTLEQQSKLDFVGSWFLLITASQFHMPFYASRMLPNMFALAFVLRCYSFWIQGNVRLAAAVLVFATAVFRCDLLLLLATFGLSWLISRKLSIITAIKIGVVTGIVSILITVPLDSLLWQRLLWPEGEVLYFNTILGKSNEWGTSTWHWYFSSALPKSMMGTILLVPLSFTRVAELLASWERRWRQKVPLSAISLFDVQWLEYFIPVMSFVMLYSFLGHKEMRFIFPAIPGLNLLAAVGMTRITGLAFPSKGKQATRIGRVAFGCGALCILLTWAGNLAFLAVSNKNYPGGAALTGLSTYVSQRSQYQKIPNVDVHIDVASAMSGVSLFGQRAAQAKTPDISWSFKKGGYEEEHAVGEDDYHEFTHLLSEQRDPPPGFRVLQPIQGNPSLNIREMEVSTEDTLFIFQRTSWGDRSKVEKDLN